MKDKIQDSIAALIISAGIVAIVFFLILGIAAVIDHREAKNAERTGNMRSQHKCGVLFIQEYGKDGWEVVYQMDDPYHDQECDDPNCDCHHSNLIALEEDE